MPVHGNGIMLCHYAQTITATYYSYSLIILEGFLKTWFRSSTSFIININIIQEKNERILEIVFKNLSLIHYQFQENT